MSDTYIHPSADQIAALRELNLQGTIFMLNLLRFAPDGGRDTYRRYGEAAAPFIAASGAQVTYLGDVHATVIGGEPWDEIILVQYPSVQAFFDMTSQPDYPSQLRSDALADSRLYCTQPR